MEVSIIANLHLLSCTWTKAYKKYKKIIKSLFVWLKIVTFAAMNKKDKLIKRFKTQPRDFTFDEVLTLFQGC